MYFCGILRSFLSHTEIQEELDEKEEMDGFVPAPPTKKKRNRTPPGQGRLNFNRLGAIKKKDSPKSLLDPSYFLV